MKRILGFIPLVIVITLMVTTKTANNPLWLILVFLSCYIGIASK